MAKRKKDIQITVLADQETKEVRVKFEQGEIIVERIPFKPPSREEDEHHGK